RIGEQRDARILRSGTSYNFCALIRRATVSDDNARITRSRIGAQQRKQRRQMRFLIEARNDNEHWRAHAVAPASSAANARQLSSLRRVALGSSFSVRSRSARYSSGVRPAMKASSEVSSGASSTAPTPCVSSQRAVSTPAVAIGTEPKHR